MKRNTCGRGKALHACVSFPISSVDDKRRVSGITNDSSVTNGLLIRIKRCVEVVSHSNIR